MLSARLRARFLGGKVLFEYPFISSVAVDMSEETFGKYEGSALLTSAERICSVAQLENETVYGGGAAALHAEGLRGRGVGIAVIDTGIYPHLDFCVPHMRIAAFVDFVGDKSYAYDDNGHGTSVAGIAASGGRFGPEGAAPLSDIIALKAVNASGTGGIIEILNAMQWIYSHCRELNIKVVNCSLGSEPIKGRDPLVMGVEALVSIGLTVVASAGNGGPEEDTIKSPGLSESAITVGGALKSGTNWTAAPFSSRGGEAVPKPDLIAPGVDIDTLKAGGGFIRMSGTSAAAPYVAGYCALLKEKYPTATPLRIKELVLSSLKSLDCPHFACGNGVLFD